MNWHWVTRLGEAQIALPVLLFAMAWSLRQRADWQRLAWWWSCLAAAALITLSTKVAFIGYGFGWAALNFTGISGHSMCAAAVYPMLARLITSSGSPAWQRGAWGVAMVVALMVGISRVMLGAHSVSEVVAGLALGLATSTAALTLAHSPAARLPLWLPLGLALWLGITPAHAPASNTHGMVTRLALAVSGRAQPYTRMDMWRERQRHRLGPSAP